MRKFIVPVAVLALVSAGAVAGTKAPDGVDVRDWKAVDANGDHYVSAEEMERHLKAQWEKNRQASDSSTPPGKAG